MNNVNEYLYNVEKILDNKELLNTRKKELELLLSENEIQLCSISLSQKRVEAEYNKDPNNLNFSNLQYLNKKYNEKELEIKKIKHAIDFFDNQINLIKIRESQFFDSNIKEKSEYEITDVELFNKIDKKINYELSSIELPSVGLISKIEIESTTYNENIEEELNKKIDELEKDINKTILDIDNNKQSVLSKEVYENTYLSIKKLITLELLLDKYLSESKTNKKLIELKNKLKYKSARFISYKDIDSNLYSKVLGLCLKIEYSLNPKEVVDAYIEREKIYNEKLEDKLIKNNDRLDLIHNNDPKKIELDNIINNLKTLGIDVSDDEIKEIKDLLS